MIVSNELFEKLSQISCHIKVLSWLLRVMTSGNIVSFSTREISKELQITQSTTIRVLRYLAKRNIIKRRAGVIFVNPDMAIEKKNLYDQVMSEYEKFKDELTNVE